LYQLETAEVLWFIKTQQCLGKGERLSHPYWIEYFSKTPLVKLNAWDPEESFFYCLNAVLVYQLVFYNGQMELSTFH
jgi:hypothetical protein